MNLDKTHVTMNRTSFLRRSCSGQ